MSKTALVTGGSRGIGRGIVRGLAEHGWNVAVNYRSNRDAAEKTADLVRSAGKGGCHIIRADISLAEDRGKLIDETVSTFGSLELLVNNAGIAPKERVDLLELKEESYDRIMDVNLKGPFFLTQAAALKMKELRRDTGNPLAVVNIGSISAYTSSTARAEYCISKAGMGMMTTLFADRLSEYGIHVYEIRPGIIETDMTGGVKDKYERLIEEGLTPVARWGRPEDVAKAVIAIAEGLLPFSTGEVINVDGGFHLRRL